MLAENDETHSNIEDKPWICKNMYKTIMVTPFLVVSPTNRTMYIVQRLTIYGMHGVR